MPLNLNGNPSLVAYVTCGDPDMATSREIILAAIDAGAEVIELGVPFSDPLADGPVIQRASQRALEHGTSLHDVLGLAGELRKLRPSVGLIVFSYLNPILRYGLERFAADCRKAGIDGALVTDLTVEEADNYRRMMREHQLVTVFLAAPTSPDERLKKIAEASSGFIYAVARTGITGVRKELSAEAANLVERIRRFTTLPIAVGFGISTPEQFAET
ncbi:MAG TPA: tryptophan synthase subunit alpha, partial [Acidimicrobiia bacterium]|nr:tryptophan synthase subunit alpha [Acidimicrobiia bacterium]